MCEWDSERERCGCVACCDFFSQLRSHVEYAYVCSGRADTLEDIYLCCEFDGAYYYAGCFPFIWVKFGIFGDKMFIYIFVEHEQSKKHFS